MWKRNECTHSQKYLNKNNHRNILRFSKLGSIHMPRPSKNDNEIDRCPCWECLCNESYQRAATRRNDNLPSKAAVYRIMYSMHTHFCDGGEQDFTTHIGYGSIIVNYMKYNKGLVVMNISFRIICLD